MSYVRKQVDVLICDICLKQPADDPAITKQFQPTSESKALDICSACWSKIKQAVEAENQSHLLRQGFRLP